MTSAIRYFLQSFRYLGNPRLSKYIWISVFVSCLLFFGMMWGIGLFTTWFSGLLGDWIPWDWAGESVLYKWVLNVLSFVLFLGMFKYIALGILGPIMSLLSERLEGIISQNQVRQKPPGLLSGTIRGIRVNVVNLSKELIYTVLLIGLSFIPGFAIVTAPLLIILQGYFAGYGVIDFYLERYCNFRESNRVVRREWIFATTVGLLFVLVFSIPIVGIILAPILGTITSTLYFEKENRLDIHFS
ncbi:MAG: EI24 domain-containing protein [Saprospiraceae bacterium]